MSKKALVTGASDGIGLAFARMLAAQGYTVMGVARREDKLKELVESLGGKHDYLVADLSTAAGQAKVVKELKTQHYDLLVNNAGVGAAGRFTDIPADRFGAMLRLNCEAVVALAHAFLSQAKSGDALINVSSTLAFLPMPGIGVYSATKAFVTSFSESLWFEQKSRGIYVMGLCPGITATQFQVNAGGRVEDLPKGLTQTPEQVVEVALKALKARKAPTVISGAKNAMMANLTRAMPRKTTVSLMGKLNPPDA